MQTPRERRLFREFERMKALNSPHSLFRFSCADLSAKEASEFLKTQVDMRIIREGALGFSKPEDFERDHPAMPPEKYLIFYECVGLARDKGETIQETSIHLMEVVFGWDYPSTPPTFVWHTPIWHPNIRMPNICLHGRPFAVGLTLAQVVVEVGRMIQYQNYNLEDPLNKDAAEWARENVARFPVDDRDLLDRRKRIGPPPQPLVRIVPPGTTVEMDNPDALVELVDTE